MRLRAALQDEQVKRDESACRGQFGVSRGDVWMGKGEPSEWGENEEVGWAYEKLTSGIDLASLLEEESGVPFVKFGERLDYNFFKDVLHAKPEELEVLKGHAPEFVGGREPERKHVLPRVGARDNEKKHAIAKQAAAMGIVRQVRAEDVHCVLPHFVVEEGGGKERWIVDCSYVNGHCVKESFTCEGHAFVREWALQSASDLQQQFE